MPGYLVLAVITALCHSATAQPIHDVYVFGGDVAQTGIKVGAINLGERGHPIVYFQSSADPDISLEPIDLYTTAYTTEITPGILAASPSVPLSAAFTLSPENPFLTG